MRIFATSPSIWVAPAILALSWGIGASQGDTFSGNWHLNVEKSRWGNVVKPHSVVIVIEHREPGIQYMGTVTYANEDTRKFGFAGAFDGKPYRMSRSFGDGQITLRRADQFSFDSAFKSDEGGYVENSHTSISRDGKTMTRKLTVRSPEGTKSWTEVYEKR